jgi:hypothetical protein
MRDSYRKRWGWPLRFVGFYLLAIGTAGLTVSFSKPAPPSAVTWSLICVGLAAALCSGGFGFFEK